jgi:hypothetical protein
MNFLLIIRATAFVSSSFRFFLQGESIFNNTISFVLVRSKPTVNQANKQRKKKVRKKKRESAGVSHLPTYVNEKGVDAAS